MCLGGAVCVVMLIIQDPDIINNLGAEFKALFSKNGQAAPSVAAQAGAYTYAQPQPSTGKFCTNCGAKMSDDQAFCVQCGTKIE